MLKWLNALIAYTLYTDTVYMFCALYKHTLDTLCTVLYLVYCVHCDIHANHTVCYTDTYSIVCSRNTGTKQFTLYSTHTIYIIDNMHIRVHRGQNTAYALYIVSPANVMFHSYENIMRIQSIRCTVSLIVKWQRWRIW